MAIADKIEDDLVPELMAVGYPTPAFIGNRGPQWCAYVEAKVPPAIRYIGGATRALLGWHRVGRPPSASVRAFEGVDTNHLEVIRKAQAAVFEQAGGIRSGSDLDNTYGAVSLQLRVVGACSSVDLTSVGFSALFAVAADMRQRFWEGITCSHSERR